MMRAIVIIASLFGFTLPTLVRAQQKDAPLDMKSAHRIFLGWVDISPDTYHLQGYSSREEYLAVINSANAAFQADCESKVFSGRTVTAAKSREDQDTTGNDLFVKFSDVDYDHKYRLRLSVHFIDLKTNTEIGSVPPKTYTAHICGLESCMNKELMKVSDEIGEKFTNGR
jgi:hypothetical protein